MELHKRKVSNCRCAKVECVKQSVAILYLDHSVFLQAVESAQAAQDIKIRFDSFQQQFQEVLCCILHERSFLSFLLHYVMHSIDHKR